MPAFRPTPLPRLGVLVLAAVLLGGAAAEGEPPVWPGVEVVEAWPGLRFKSPLGLVSPGDGSGDLYVWEQGGLVKRLPEGSGHGPTPTSVPTPRPEVFLDLSDRIFPRVQGGLLGLAFHPAYATNGKFYVTTLRGEMGKGFEWVLSEIRAPGGVADPKTERVLLRVPKSTAMHNGGWVAFAPDGMLFASTGDNAKQEEAQLTSQSPQSLLGKILRIDVDREEGRLPYGIPADNPWATYKGGQVRREIFAYGMRNPWQFCFDGGGHVWTAEPGTKGPGCRESVFRIHAGKNHGWPYFEGSKPALPIPPGREHQDFVMPVFEYLRGPEPDLTAAWGGVFYRGRKIPALRGRYLFGDYPRGEVYALDLATGQGLDWRLLARIKGVCRIGEDAEGEIYFVSLDQGKVFKLLPQS